MQISPVCSEHHPLSSVKYKPHDDNDRSSFHLQHEMKINRLVLSQLGSFSNASTKVHRSLVSDFGSSKLFFLIENKEIHTYFTISTNALMLDM